MNRMNKLASRLGRFSSGASLGGKVSHYRFRKRGFIDYNGALEVRPLLRKVLRSP